jgi:4-amino-4-deoxy-L-arabinose transferase-like glycosyltransferase
VLHHHVIAEFTINRVLRSRNTPGRPTVITLDTIKMHLIVYWILIAVILGFSLRWRRSSQVWMAFVYLAGGLALMGKGLIGPGLIGLLILAHMLVTGRLHLLLRCGLPLGILIFVVTCFPWHHSMWLFRGERWARELLFENNLARFTTGEQPQAVGSFVFYARTMGMAAFPWVAAVPIALYAGWRWFSPRTDPEEAGSSRELHRFAVLLFLVTFAAITYGTTKYYHYLLPALPPLAIVIGVWIDDLLRRDASSEMSRSLALGGTVAGLCILGLVVREAVLEPAWIAHLTTYLYTGMWREGAPVPNRLVWISLPFALALFALAARRTRLAIGAMVFSALLTTVYVVDDYLPAASESWSQRTAFRHYFDNRGPKDPILGWWFKYRGETYFAKARVWMLKNPDRKKLADFIDKNRGTDLDYWFITTVGHGKRLRTFLPVDLRDELVLEYENFHYVLMRLPIP